MIKRKDSNVSTAYTEGRIGVKVGHIFSFICSRKDKKCTGVQRNMK